LLDLDTLVAANIAPIIGGLLVVVLALVLAVIGLIRRVRTLGRRIESMTRGNADQSIEGVLEAHLDQVRQAVQDVAAVSDRTAALEREVQGSFGRVGLVRFNPFEDTGGNQSFAIALLDGRGDGFVISSLHARGGTRMYAKTVARGTSDANLSGEETEALRMALAKPVPGTSG
jgi:hypothetical protein